MGQTMPNAVDVIESETPAGANWMHDDANLYGAVYFYTRCGRVVDVEITAYRDHGDLAWTVAVSTTVDAYDGPNAMDGAINAFHAVDVGDDVDAARRYIRAVVANADAMIDNASDANARTDAPIPTPNR